MDLSATDPQVVFGALALLIFLGFLGNHLFSRYRVNDTLILVGVGFLLGPVFNVIPVPPVERLAGVMGALALLLILFDGGLTLRFRDIIHGAGKAVALAVLGFAFTMLAVAAAVVQWLPGATWGTGFTLGAIVGGTSAVIVLPTLAQVRASPKTTAALALESALTDILVVVAAFSLIGMELAKVNGTEGATAGGITSSITVLFLVSLALGTVAGLLWLFILPGVREKPFGYMMTLGTAFALYVAVEWILQDTSSGGGPLSVLAFGIVLGNAGSLGNILRNRAGGAFGSGIKRFQGELSFLVRTVFFVILGILVDPAAIGDARVLGVGFAIFLAIAIARYVATMFTTMRIVLEGEGWLMWLMMPRGLAAAVMAAVPAARGMPGSEHFVAIAFVVIVLTNLATTVGGFLVKPGDSPGRIPARLAPSNVTSETEGDVVFQSRTRKPKRG